MKRRFATAFFTLLPFALPAFGKSTNKPDMKVNPEPKMRYELTLSIEGAPGPFDAVEGSAGYEVSNDACVPLTPFSGATIIPTKSVPMPLTRTNKDEYKGVLYVDLLVDEDYFGQGLCRWSVPFTGFLLHKGNLLFGHSIALDDVLAGRSVTRYFNNASYTSEDAKLPKSDHPRVSSGLAKRDEFKDPRNTFSMTISAKQS